MFNVLPVLAWCTVNYSVLVVLWCPRSDVGEVEPDVWEKHMYYVVNCMVKLTSCDILYQSPTPPPPPPLHTHTKDTKDTKDKGQRCKELPNGICSPRPNKAGTPVRLLQGTLGLVLDKLLEPGQALAGALTMPFHCGVGT